MECYNLLFLSYVSIALYWMKSELPTSVQPDMPEGWSIASSHSCLGPCPSPPFTEAPNGQGILMWAPEQLHVCCYAAMSVGSSGYVRSCTYFSGVELLLCSEGSDLVLLGVRFGKWGCVGWVRDSKWNRSSVAKFEKWQLPKAVQTDEAPECYRLQQPCFSDLVRDFWVRCLNLLEELTLCLCSLNVSCCMDDRS